MKIAVYDTHTFEQVFFPEANQRFHHEFSFFNTRLTTETAKLAAGFPCVCCFVNDILTKDVLKILKAGGTQLIALRSAGFNHVDLKAAEYLDLKVVRVPQYSPYAIAEHAVALILTLNRKTHRAYNRNRDGNFSLDGLVGFDMNQKTIGIIGTGYIGSVMAKIMNGFGCRILAFDIAPNAELEKKYAVHYVNLETLLKESDIISLHVPLLPQTFHLIDESAFNSMKPGAMLINTGRGALIDTKALIKSLKNGHLGSAGLDVYEEEAGVFFEDHSEEVLQDDVLARLLTFHNVLLTSHQGFLTKEALANIAETTLSNISQFEHGEILENQVIPKT